MRLSRAAFGPLLIMTLLGILMIPGKALAVSSQTLIEGNKIYNGRTVTFQGEVIGDILRRGNDAWINVNDDSYAYQSGPLGKSSLAGYNSGQAIHLPSRLTEQISHLGRYDSHGDIVRITGTFQRASVRHGGDMMIEGKTLIVIRRGGPLPHRAGTLEPILLLVLGAVTAFYGLAAYLPSRK